LLEKVFQSGAGDAEFEAALEKTAANVQVIAVIVEKFIQLIDRDGCTGVSEQLNVGFRNEESKQAVAAVGSRVETVLECHLKIFIGTATNAVAERLGEGFQTARISGGFAGGQKSIHPITS